MRHNLIMEDSTMTLVSMAVKYRPTRHQPQGLVIL